MMQNEEHSTLPSLIAAIRACQEPLLWTDEAQVLTDVGGFIGREISSLDDMTVEEAQRVVAKLEHSMEIHKMGEAQRRSRQQQKRQDM